MLITCHLAEGGGGGGAGGVSHGTVQGKVLILPALTWLLVSWEPCNHHIRVSERDAT